MKRLMQRWFAPPIASEDDDHHRRAVLLNAISTVVLVFLILSIVGLALGGRSSLATWIMNTLMILNALLVHYWQRKNRLSLAGLWLIGAGFVLLTFNMVGLGTIRTPGTATFLLLVIIAGMLFDARGILFATVISSLLVLGMVIAENAGLLPNPDFTVTITQWVSYTALFGLTGSLTYYANQIIIQALRRSKTEILERQRAEVELRTLSSAVEKQRDLLHGLASATSIEAALHLCLDNLLDAAGMDCGGIYLVDRATRDLHMVVSKDLSDEFVRDAACVPAGSPRWQVVMSGKPLYTTYQQLPVQNTPSVEDRLRAVGVIPLLYQGQVIACFNLASRSLDEVSPSQRETIEEIAMQVVHALVRIQAQEDFQKSHDELLASEARFRSLFEQTHDAVFMLDLEGRFLSSNQRAADMFGYTRSEMIGTSFEDSSIEVEASRQVFSRVLAGEMIPLYERRFRSKNGKILSLEVSVELVKDENGTPLHIQGVARDITARKKTEQALKDAEQQLRKTLDTIPDLIWSSHPDGTIKYGNQAWLSFTGMTLEQARGNGWTQAVHPQDRPGAEQKWAEAIHTHSVFEVELRLRRFDGEYRWFLARAHPLLDLQGEVLEWYGSITDIDARKQAENQLQAAHDLLEQRVQERTLELQMANLALEKAVRARDEFMAAVTHELRTPLTGILGLSDALQLKTYGDLNERQLGALLNIEKSGRRLLRLINDVLEYSRLQSGKTQLEIAPCSLTAVCQAVLRAVEGMANDKKQRLEFRFSADSLCPEGDRIYVDERRLHQILFNLLENAVKFTPEGGRIELVAACLSPERRIKISVSDTGIGMQQEHLPRLFQPFVQLDARLARSHSGTGLGLALVQALVELHGGSVEVQSIFGEGSCFIVLLPYSQETV